MRKIYICNCQIFKVGMYMRNKRALMGIGTLIIFIATILVAAVAAAVLISTSNVLQQRSLIVGQEARKSITNAVEVISIMAATDATTEKFNNFEMLIRLSPGSDALQMRNFDLQYISPNFDEAAILAYQGNQTNIAVNNQLNVSEYYTLVSDIDGDGESDNLTLIENVSGTAEGVKVWLTSKDNWTDNISIGVDLANAASNAVTINSGEIPLIYEEEVYAIIVLTGTTAGARNTINTSVNITIKSVAEICDFDTLQPETKYCFKVMNGNSDLVLGSGERIKLYYKTKSDNRPGIGEDFQYIFTNEKGRLSEARARTPDVITSTKAKLWPLG